MENKNSLPQEKSNFCDKQGEMVTNLLKSKVPSMKNQDPVQLKQTMRIINVGATILMIICFYLLPVLPAFKGEGSLSYSSVLSTLNEVMGTRAADNMGFSFKILYYFGGLVSVLLFLNVATFSTYYFAKKEIKFLNSRYISLAVCILLFFVVIINISNIMFGMYILFLLSIITALTGLPLKADAKTSNKE